MKTESKNLDPFFAWEFLLEECHGMNPDQVLPLVVDGLQQTGTGKALDDILEQMISFIGLPKMLPPDYVKYSPLLIHGISFILSHLPVKRLADKMVAQLFLSPNSSSGDRICLLINDMPILQKLGQIICRNPGLDPSLKKALIRLEDNVDSISYADLKPHIQKEIQATGLADNMEVEETILAEASICAVSSGALRGIHPEKESQIVLKIVKPSVQQNLKNELETFDLLADYFDQNKKKWDIGNLQFRDTFSQVRHMIENEVNLPIEQSNLAEARTYYRNDKHIIVPEPFGCSTPHMTVMSRLNGNKITDVEHLTAEQRHLLASNIVDICILKPLQDVRTFTIFHGDPHAGNIAYRFEGKKPQIIFYDWGMMGQLSQRQRYALGLMAFGSLLNSPETIIFAVQLATEIAIDRDKIPILRDSIVKVLNDRDRGLGSLLSTLEKLFESLSQNGIIFPNDFLMFEKAMVTLNGVLADIDPDFSRDHYLLQASLREFFFSIIRMQFQLDILNKTLSMYRFSFWELLKFQKSVTRYTLENGLLWLKPGYG